MSNTKKEKEQRPTCGQCLECIRTYMGCYCNLTDNQVDETDEGCIDFIAEDPDYE